MFERDPRTAKIGEELLPLKVGYLPEFFRIKGESELRYTPSVRENSLRELKTAIADDHAIKSLQLTDEALLLFLNARKYDINRTVLQLNSYRKYHNNNIYLYINVKFEVLLPYFSSKLISVLPWRCQDGCLIVLFQLGNWDSKIHCYEALGQSLNIILLDGLRDPMTQVNGFKLIFDLNINLEVLKICTPHNLYQLYIGAEKNLPGRMKGYHIVNMATAGRAAYHVMKVFFSQKMRERVHIHKSCDTLLDFFPSAILPFEYGGDLKDYDMTEWLRKASSPEELAFLNMISN